jgi:predicted ABC-type ATPase
MSTPERQAVITVLAGVNGAGKSSIGGAHLRAQGAEYFNPDEAARKLMTIQPGLDVSESNGLAWQEGKRRLEKAIAEGGHFTFEATLGGNTITRLSLEAAATGARLQIWYAGLANVELHLQRVAARVRKGGHDIPEREIRKRWTASMANLIRLIPSVTTLRVYDNSAERDPAQGQPPEPRLLLAIDEKQFSYPPPEALTDIPAWAKPLVFVAYSHFGLLPPK